MIALYIIAAVLSFILLLLLCPLRFHLKYSDDEVKFNIRYLFLKFQILPEKPPKKQKEEKAKQADKVSPEEQKKENPFLSFIKRHKLKGSVQIVKQISKIILAWLKSIIKHTKLKSLNVYVGYVGNDAADTATKVGLISALSYPVFTTFIANNKSTKEYFFKVEPLFIADKPKIYVYTKLKIKPLFILMPSVKAAVKGLKLMLKLKKENQADKNKINKVNNKEVTA